MVDNSLNLIGLRGPFPSGESCYCVYISSFFHYAGLGLEIEIDLNIDTVKKKVVQNVENA